MKRLFGLLLLCGLATVVPVQASSILYFVDGNNGTDQMAAALAALSGSYNSTTAATTAAFETALTSGTYNLAIFSAQESYGPDYTTALSDLEAFVQAGGNAIVNSWFISAADLNQFGADFTGSVNGPSVNMTGFNSGVANPVLITNPVPPYATFSTGLSLDATNGAYIAGTFLDPGNASGTNGQAAVIVGDGGRSIVNGFLNDTAGAQGEQIYINEINALETGSTLAPEPSSWTMLALAFATMAACSRIRRQKASDGNL